MHYADHDRRRNASVAAAIIMLKHFATNSEAKSSSHGSLKIFTACGTLPNHDCSHSDKGAEDANACKPNGTNSCSNCPLKHEQQSLYAIFDVSMSRLQHLKEFGLNP